MYWFCTDTAFIRNITALWIRKIHPNVFVISFTKPDWNSKIIWCILSWVNIMYGIFFQHNTHQILSELARFLWNIWQKHFGVFLVHTVVFIGIVGPMWVLGAVGVPMLPGKSWKIILFLEISGTRTQCCRRGCENIPVRTPLVFVICSYSDKTFFFATCDSDEHCSMDATVMLLYVE